MPKRSQGQKRRADVTGDTVHLMRIAASEIEETPAAKKRKKATERDVGDTADKITRAPKNKR